MHRYPIDMKPPQPKMPLEPPKFTVPDVTLMLENDDSLIVKPGMNIPLRLSTPDQKGRSPHIIYPRRDQHISRDRNSNDQLPHSNGSAPSKQPFKYGSDNKLSQPERKMSTKIPAAIAHENLIDNYKQSKERQNSERKTYTSNQTDIDQYIHSPPVLSDHENYISNNPRNESKMPVGNCNPFWHQLQSVNYIPEDDGNSNRKFYSESNYHYEMDRHKDSPKTKPESDIGGYHTEKYVDYKPADRYESPRNLCAMSKEKYVRFACNNGQIRGDRSSPDISPYPNTENSSPRMSIGNQQVLFDIIQRQTEQIQSQTEQIHSQTEQILNLHKLLGQALDQRRTADPSPVQKLSVMTQTKCLSAPSMTSTETWTELTSTDIKYLLEFKRLSDEKNNIPVDIQKCVCVCDLPADLSPRANDCPTDSCNPREVKFYNDVAYDNRPDNDHGSPSAKRGSFRACNSHSPPPDKSQSDENGITIQNNVQINIHQQVHQHAEYGRDGIPYKNQTPNHIKSYQDIMKKQLEKYQSVMGPSTREDMNLLPDYTKLHQILDGNPAAFGGGFNNGPRNQANRQAPNDGQLAAIAAASPKERNHLEYQRPPNNQVVDNKPNPRNVKVNQFYSRNGLN